VASEPSRGAITFMCHMRVHGRTNTSSSAYLATSHRTEPVPPEPDRLVADIDPALEQDVFGLAQR
jgi:hypothetical protein